MSVLDHQLQIFQESLTDESISSVDYHPYHPETETPGTTQVRYEINVKDTSSWTNISRAYLEVQAKIVKADGATAIDAENIALVGSGYSLWERAQLLIDNQVVEEVNHQHIASLVKLLAGTSDDYYRTTLSNAGFYKDTGTGTAVPADNTGFATKKALAAGSNQMEFHLPLKHMFGFCNIDKIMTNMRVSIVLTRNSHANMIFQDNGADNGNKVYLNRVRLFVPTITPSIQAISQIEGKLNAGFSQRLEWLKVNCYKSPLFQAGDTTPQWRISNSSVKPRHVFIAIQKQSQDQDEEENNQIFSTQNVTEVFMRVNSEQVPREKIETDYNAATKSTTRAYSLFQKYKNRFGDSDSGSLVNNVDFSSGLYNIYYFDLTRIEPTAFHTSGQADLEVRMRRTGNDAMVMYAVVCSEAEATVSGVGSQLRLEMM